MPASYSFPFLIEQGAVYDFSTRMLNLVVPISMLCLSVLFPALVIVQTED